jgi:phosphatidylglycerophosphate synthase
MSPADRVTTTRAALGGVCLAIVVASAVSELSVRSWWMLVPAVVALLLDAVDGPVARATGTAGPRGARFDMEVDAAIVLVLSIAVGTVLGWWVLAIGAMRYLYLGLAKIVPVLDTPVPRSRFRVSVAVLQGVALSIALAPFVPVAVGGAVVAVALALLVASFVHQAFAAIDVAHPPGGRLRRAGGVTATVASGLVVWVALVMPNRPSLMSFAAFVGIPLEGLVVVAVAAALPSRWRRFVAVLSGVVIGVLLIVKVFDLGFRTVFARPFDLLNDWYFLGPGVGVLGDSIGHAAAVGVAVFAGVLALGVLVLLPLCMLRLTSYAARHPTGTSRTVVALGIVWVVAAVLGVQVTPGVNVASTTSSSLVYDEVQQVRFDLKDRKVFDGILDKDPYAQVPSNQLLTSLRGKDVLLVFVESYGRVAVEGTSYSPAIGQVLDDGARRLRDVGYRSRSGWLRSPTFGAGSWLAHATLQSGVWVNSQQRYSQLFDHGRMTLTDAFRRAGWRTVFDDPSNTKDWPEGQDFYHYDQMYDVRNVGYHGPSFGYANIPDQWTLAKFRENELLQADRPPVMAEIDLVSSHHPWAPLPRMVPWDQLGDGSVYDGMPEQGQTADEVLGDDTKVRAAYGQSIEYSLTSLVSFLHTYPDKDLVLVVLGDHQPHSYVTGPDPGYDVPISVIAQDPKVMRQISGWGWDRGLRPGHGAPVATMHTFRDTFLSAFGSPPPSG